MRKTILKGASALVLAALSASVSAPILAQETAPATMPAADPAPAPAPAPATTPAALTPEQQAIFDAWPADKKADYATWPQAYKDYYWSLKAEQQTGYWALTADQRGQVYKMTPEQREIAWTSILQQLAGNTPTTPPGQANPPGPGMPTTGVPNPQTAEQTVRPAMPADQSYQGGPYKGALTPPPAAAMNKDYPVCTKTVTDGCRNRGGV